MKYIDIRGARIPALGFGTSTLQGRQARESVLDAIEIGYRHIDTAENYDNEEAVGAAIEESGVSRGELFITTKVWWDDLGFEDTLAVANGSLERLRTDYIDLLLVHWPNGAIPIHGTLDAMQRLRDEGWVRNIGVSNFTPDLLTEALAAAPIICNQIEYHPLLAQQRMLELAREHDLMVTAYCPLAQGRVLREPAIERMSRAHDRTPAQIVLRWHMQQPGVAAIPRSTSTSHRRDNFAVFDFELSSAEMDEIHSLDRAHRIIDPSFAPDWSR